jgi:type IV pilus assembly protein PilQ
VISPFLRDLVLLEIHKIKIKKYKPKEKPKKEVLPVIPPPERVVEGKPEKIEPEKIEMEEIRPRPFPRLKVIKEAPEQRLISLDIKNADLLDVLRLIAHKAGVNILPGPEVGGTVTVTLEDVPWETALKLILETQGYSYVYIKEGRIIRVGLKEKLETETTTKVISLNYADAEEVVGSISPILSPVGKIEVNKRTNSLIITDNHRALSKIISVLKELDKRTPQVMIEARIVEVHVDAAKELGINWSAAREGSTKYRMNAFGNAMWQTGGDVTVDEEEVEIGGIKKKVPIITTSPTLGGYFIFGRLFEGFDIDAKISALVSEDRANILATPKVCVLNNKEANIITGQEIPYITTTVTEGGATQTISFKEVGIKLTVTPKISPDNFITLKVHPEVSKLYKWVNQQPVIDTREVESEILVKSGETIVIGGIIKDTWYQKILKVPYLGDIPLIGKLFRSQIHKSEKTELMIFITPTLIYQS